MCAQHVAMHTIIRNFCEENFRDQRSNHEIHENIVPRKFGAIWYVSLYYCVSSIYAQWVEQYHNNYYYELKVIGLLSQKRVNGVS